MIKNFLFLCLVFSLSGCVGLAVLPASIALSEDERTISDIVDDNALSGSLYDALSEMEILDEYNSINFKTYEGFILSTGQVEDKINYQRIETLLGNYAENYLNALTIQKPIDLEASLKDSWITAKIKTQLSILDFTSLVNVHVISENSQTYLLGRLDDIQRKIVLEKIKKISGIKKIHDLTMGF